MMSTEPQNWEQGLNKSSTIEAFYLPPVLAERIPGWLTLMPRAGGVTLRVPQITRSFMTEIQNYLRRSARTHLATRTLDERLDALDRVARRWLNPRSQWRQQAESWLPEVTGYSRPVLAEGLELMAKGLLREELEAMLQREMTHPEALTRFVALSNGRMTRAWAPEIMTVILAGNLPISSPPPLVKSLLLGSACLARSSRSDPVSAALFARSIASEEPALGACIASLWWNGADRALEETVFDNSDAVILYGSHDTVRSVARRIPEGTPVLRYGHRIGFAILARDYCNPDDGPVQARALARDICLFDQQGCVSPQMLFVETGGKWTAERFAESLAHALGEVGKELPRTKPSTETSLALMQFRAAAEFQSSQERGKKSRIWSSEGNTEWTVVFRSAVELQPSPLNRVICVTDVEDMKETVSRISKQRPFLQTAVYGFPPERRTALADTLGRAGVTRLAPFGSSQAVFASWQHDGRPNLTDLLRWTDLET